VAHHIMMNCSPGQFDMDLLKLFFTNVAIYPVGTVLLTTHGYGIVSKVIFGQTERPQLILFADKEGHRCQPRDVNLFAETDEIITKVLMGTELFHFIDQLGFDPATLLVEQ